MRRRRASGSSMAASIRVASDPSRLVAGTSASIQTESTMGKARTPCTEKMRSCHGTGSTNQHTQTSAALSTTTRGASYGGEKARRSSVQNASEYVEGRSTGASSTGPSLTVPAGLEEVAAPEDRLSARGATWWSVGTPRRPVGCEPPPKLDDGGHQVKIPVIWRRLSDGPGRHRPRGRRGCREPRALDAALPLTPGSTPLASTRVRTGGNRCHTTR